MHPSPAQGCLLPMPAARPARQHIRTRHASQSLTQTMPARRGAALQWQPRPAGRCAAGGICVIEHSYRLKRGSCTLKSPPASASWTCKRFMSCLGQEGSLLAPRAHTATQPMHQRRYRPALHVASPQLCRRGKAVQRELVPRALRPQTPCLHLPNVPCPPTLQVVTSWPEESYWIARGQHWVSTSPSQGGSSCK